MDMQWTVYVQRHEAKVEFRRRHFDGRWMGPSQTLSSCRFREGRELLGTLRRTIAQDQIVACDVERRRCRHCGRCRRTKAWRPRVFATGPGQIHVRMPHVISCLCTPEPLDDDDEPADLRVSECSIEQLLPARRTPERSCLCAKHGASSSYRTAAHADSRPRGFDDAQPRLGAQGDDRLRRADRGCTVLRGVACRRSKDQWREAPPDSDRRHRF